MQQEADRRAKGRSNVYLTALLESGGETAPVRIRNLSDSGALIEAEILPSIGARVRITRGALHASGAVVWSGTGRAGVNFDGKVDVEAWIRRVGHAGQQQVDRMVAAIRGAKAMPSAMEEPEPPSLAALSISLDEICDRFALSDFPVELEEELLKLDVLAQSLRSMTGRRRR